MSVFPNLQKAKRIIGKNLVFKDVKPSDAAFILSLRTDINKSRHLSKTSPELDNQIDWIKSYAKKFNEAYFIIESFSGEKLGTVRLYDQKDDSFCWGSWIIKDGAPKTAAIESALIVYSYAIDVLGFKRAHFDVRKENEGVWLFHERFGAIRIGESSQDYFYIIEYDKIKSSQKRYEKYLNSPIVIER